MALEQAEHELLEIARAHHVHFDVEPEVTFRATDRVKVGFEVRLWAAHARGARAMPGCSKCRDLAAGLQRIAEWAVPSEYRATRIEIEPFPSGLVRVDGRSRRRRDRDRDTAHPPRRVRASGQARRPERGSSHGTRNVSGGSIADRTP